MSIHDGNRAPNRTPIGFSDEPSDERPGIVKIIMRDGVMLPEPEWVMPDCKEPKLTYGRSIKKGGD